MMAEQEPHLKLRELKAYPPAGARAVTKKRELEPADAPIAATMGRSAWTSGVMIVRMIQAKGKA